MRPGSVNICKRLEPKLIHNKPHKDGSTTKHLKNGEADPEIQTTTYVSALKRCRQQGLLPRSNI